MTLFEILNNIFEKKGELPPEGLKEYQPFIINRALSQYRDLVFFADTLNALSIKKEWHYQFLYHVVSKKRRFSQWNKTTDDKQAIEMIQQYYGYSYNKAKDVLPLLAGNLEFIKSQLNQGGRK